ncbi:ABC transporter ATP-binding protein [Streptomyces sp. SS8]
MSPAAQTSGRRADEHPSDTVISAVGLTKTFRTLARRPGRWSALKSLAAPRYASLTAVRDVSLAVRRGELLALLGPNGAGKSTTIKMLTGILVPSAGSVRVNGLVPHRERELNARNIGAVFGQRSQLWWDLPARESLSILRDIYGVDTATYRARLEEFDGLLHLSEFWDTRVRHLSLGQRVRCDLACALLHDPAVVFLDEPTIGMDVEVKEQVRRFLRHQVQERGRSVLLTTHDVSEVERLAHHVVLVNHGRVVFDGDLPGLRARFGSSWQVSVTLADPVAVQPPEGVRVLRRDGPRVVFGPAVAHGEPGQGQAPCTAQEALRSIIGTHAVTDVSLTENDLEDVIRLAYQEKDNSPPAGAGHPDDARGSVDGRAGHAAA